MRRYRLVLPALALVIAAAAAVLLVFLDDIAAAQIRKALDESLAGSATRAELDGLSLTVFSANPRARLAHLQLQHDDPDSHDGSHLQAVFDTASVSTSWGALLSGTVALDHVALDSARLVITLPPGAQASDGDAAADTTESPVDTDNPAPADTAAQAQSLGESVEQRLAHIHTALKAQFAQWPAWLTAADIPDIEVRLIREASTTPLLAATGSLTVRPASGARLASLALTGVANPDTLSWPALADDGRFALTIDARLDTDASLTLGAELVSGGNTLRADADTHLAATWRDSESNAELSLTDALGPALRTSIRQQGNAFSLQLPESPRHRSDLSLSATIADQEGLPGIRGTVVSQALRPEEISDVMQAWLPTPATDSAGTGGSDDPDEPLALKPPTDLHIRFELDIAQLEYRQLQAHDVKGQLHSSPTALSLDIASDTIADGTLSVSIEQAQQDADYRGKVYLGLQNTRIEPILSLVASERLLTGRATSEWEFGFDGTSIETMRSSLFGEGYLLIEEGQIDSMAVELAGIDLQESLALMFKKDFHQYTIECGYTDVSAKQGRIEIEHFLLDAGDTWFQADGYADLAADRIDFTLKPRPKDASYLSLTSSLHVRGPLSSPKIRPGKKLYGKLAVGAALAALVSPVGLVLPMIRLGDGEERQPCAEMEIE